MKIDRRRRTVTLNGVRANLGLEMKYRRQLEKFVSEMNKSVTYWLKAAYRANEPAVIAVAQDETPANALRRAVRKLGRQWQKRFDTLAPELAEYFSKAVADRSDAALRSALRRGGFSVKFRMTPAMRDILQATVHENVNLIKSIPQKYLSDVEGIVMRGVQTGRDLGQVTKDLQQAYGITYRRAALISRDQNNKASAAMNRARQLELGIKKAIWMHSGGGHVPRPTHLANSGKEYDVEKGWLDPHEGKYIHPGELISCRCYSKSVIKGFTA